MMHGARPEMQKACQAGCDSLYKGQKQEPDNMPKPMPLDAMTGAEKGSRKALKHGGK